MRRGQLLRHPYGFLATGLGSGLSPYIPGTVGTLAALPFALALCAAPWWVFALVTLGLFAVGVPAAQWVIDQLGRQDPGEVVVDEWVGLLLTLGPIRYLSLDQSRFFEPSNFVIVAISAFLVFRLFDIAKPWPASWADRAVPGGFGAMLDDAIAGLQAGLALWLVGHWVLK